MNCKNCNCLNWHPNKGFYCKVPNCNPETTKHDVREIYEYAFGVTNSKMPQYNKVTFRSYANRVSHDIIFATREEAHQTLDSMHEIMDTYENVTLADFYDLAGMNSSYSDNKMGWITLKNVDIKRVRDGYIIDLPTPMDLT